MLLMWYISKIILVVFYQSEKKIQMIYYGEDTIVIILSWWYHLDLGKWRENMLRNSEIEYSTGYCWAL